MSDSSNIALAFLRKKLTGRVRNDEMAVQVQDEGKGKGKGNDPNPVSHASQEDQMQFPQDKMPISDAHHPLGQPPNTATAPAPINATPALPSNDYAAMMPNPWSQAQGVNGMFNPIWANNGVPLAPSPNIMQVSLKPIRAFKIVQG